MADNASRNSDRKAQEGKVYNMAPGPEANIGKVPPQSLEMEEAVLGALLLEKDALHRVIDALTPDMFYKTANREIYEAIQTLFQRSEPIDILSVKEFLRKAGKLDMIGGAYYLAQLTSNVASSANIEFHSRIVAEKYLLRRLITMCGDTLEKAYDPTTDALELLDRAEQQVFEVSESQLRKNYSSMDTLVMETLERLEEIRGKDSGVTGIPSGFTELDAMTAGWQRTDMVIIAARPAMGKCLGKGTKVLMLDGQLKKVEEICTGDLLMGPDSQPRRVKSIATGREKMYWVRQNQGIDYRVNESHLLSLKRSRREGGFIKGEILNISVKDYLQKSSKFQSNYKGYKVAVDFETKDLPFDPYFLGLWLGDGRKSDIRIANQDEEVISFLEAYASELNMELHTYKHPEKVAMHAIVAGPMGHKGPSLQAELRKMDLIQEKHIPSRFLINSKENRLLLLAGLIDSDGHYYAKHNGYEISQKDESLARQIKFLCDSLGYKTSIRKKKATIAKIGYEADVWRVRFSGSIDEIPVRIPRKMGNPYTVNRDWQVTGISVEFDKVDDYYGFELEGADGLFCLEDMTVTHNTALTLTLARNAAVRFNTGVALFSLEMAGVQLTQRLITTEAELDAQKVRTGRLEDYEWKQLITRIGGLSKAPIYIDDTPGLSITDLRAKARRLKAERDIGIIMIDYLQLMTGSTAKGGNREQEIAGISRSLKIIAKELDVCVIALSQLSRAVESRGGDKRPMLSDLRESGSIEQDADMVAFLYRPEYYGFETDEEGNSTQGLAELIIAKQRNGPTGTVKLQFIGKYGKFTDWGFNANTEVQSAYGQLGDVSGQSGNTITFQSKINQSNSPDDSLDVPF